MWPIDKQLAFPQKKLTHVHCTCTCSNNYSEKIPSIGVLIINFRVA